MYFILFHFTVGEPGKGTISFVKSTSLSESEADNVNYQAHVDQRTD